MTAGSRSVSTCRLGITAKGGEILHRYTAGGLAYCGVELVAEINEDAPTDFRFWPRCKRCEKASQRTRRSA